MVSEADSAVLYLCAQTDYEDQFPHYRSGIDPVPQALQRVQVAAEKGYEALYQAHLADYQALFDRVEIQVGQEETSLPTDKLLKKYKKGRQSRLLEMLYFRSGRYLLIASSVWGACRRTCKAYGMPKTTRPGRAIII